MAPGSHRRFAALLVLALLLSALPASLRPAAATPRLLESIQPASTQSDTESPEPVTSHPRLWITQDDLPRLRGWATDANPIWRDGLAPLIERMKADMDAGTVPGEDDGLDTYQPYPTESYAEFFAFLSLVHPDEAARADYAERARTLLMYAHQRGGQRTGRRRALPRPVFRHPVQRPPPLVGRELGADRRLDLSLLTDEDKATIREVFLRWSEEIVTQGYNHPDPIGVTNDPALFANRAAFRWSGNNYFTSHMRNLGLMALALDPEDDPGGELGAYLETAIGAHLYMTDQLLRTDAAVVSPPKASSTARSRSPTSPSSCSPSTPPARTTRRSGDRRSSLTDNPFWDEVIPGFLHSLSPRNRPLARRRRSTARSTSPPGTATARSTWAPT